LRWRPYDGLENFSRWRSLRRAIVHGGGTVQAEHGLHLWPFQFGLHQLSRAADARLQLCRDLMINICVLADEKIAKPQGHAVSRDYNEEYKDGSWDQS
jgi:hypothetical protein